MPVIVTALAQQCPQGAGKRSNTAGRHTVRIYGPGHTLWYVRTYIQYAHIENLTLFPSLCHITPYYGNSITSVKVTSPAHA